MISKICRQCGSKLTEMTPEQICENCLFKNLASKLIKTDSERIDQFIFNNFIIDGIVEYKKLLNIPLKGAIEIYQWRYSQLREAFPEKFRLSKEEYWKGFYS